MDEDGGGSIERDEWEGALDKVGYFGPSGPIFSCWAANVKLLRCEDGRVKWHGRGLQFGSIW